MGFHLYSCPGPQILGRASKEPQDRVPRSQINLLGQLSGRGYDREECKVVSEHKGGQKNASFHLCIPNMKTS